MESTERFMADLVGGYHRCRSRQLMRQKDVRERGGGGMLRHRSQRRRNILRRNFRILTLSHAAESSRMMKTWMSLLELVKSLITSIQWVLNSGGNRL